MNNLEIKNDIKIESLIYEIREKQVMLDSDLARIYQCKNGTKEINQAVKNNVEKFPQRFSWRLTKEESDTFLVKNFDQKKENRGGRYDMPRVFTEQGVYMLSTILKSKEASKIIISIMDAFVTMRRYISNDLIKQGFINNMVIEHDEKIKLLQESFDKFENSDIKNHIFFEGQIYDAYSLLMSILSKAKKEIIIMDNYAGRYLFDLLKNINIDIKIYSKNIEENDYIKYKEQYNNIEIIHNDKFHDRFIIIDNKILYHCGSSFKDLGKKCFAITVIEDKGILNKIISQLSTKLSN